MKKRSRQLPRDDFYRQWSRTAQPQEGRVNPFGRHSGSPLCIVPDAGRFAEQRERRWLLVSFCNQPVGTPLLGLFDADRMRFRALELPFEIRRTHNGANGLAANDAHIYVALVGPYFSSLLILDRRSLDILRWHELPGASAAHSIAIIDRTLYAVSTGTDVVLEYLVDDDDVRTPTRFWSPDTDGPPEDRHHLNGLSSLANGGFLVSGLDIRGRCNDPDARPNANGFVRAIPEGRRFIDRLWDPHSVMVIGEGIAVCESGTSTVHLIGDNLNGVIRGFPGYARGMCLAGNDLFVATSIGRYARNSARFQPYRTCSISRCSLDSLEIEQTIVLSAWANEIYDLLRI